MAKAKKRPEKPAAEVIKRGRDRQALPPHLDAFARGDDDAIWRREREGGRIDDPRPVALVPGVKNADARAVGEARIERMRAAAASRDERRLAIELAEARALGIWRPLSIVGFDAMAEAVVGLRESEARALERRGREELGLPDRLKPAEIAVWMRAEAGMLEVRAGGRVGYKDGRLRIEVSIEHAADALAAAGRREAPMTKVPMGPDTMMDRPAGVPSMRDVIERERRTREDE